VTVSRFTDVKFIDGERAKGLKETHRDAEESVWMKHGDKELARFSSLRGKYTIHESHDA
jgi:hypothetical protein